MKANEFQKYIIFSLEEHNKTLCEQIDAQTAVMQQEDLVTRLKLRERSVLLTELSRQVNELRRVIISEGSSKKLPVPFGISKSTTELPRLRPISPSDSSLLPNASQITNGISELKGCRPTTTASRSDLNSPMKAKIRPLHDKPFTAPLYHLKEEIFEIGELGYMEDKPIKKQTNFLRAKHMEMFAASAGAQAEISPVAIDKKLKQQQKSTKLVMNRQSSPDRDLLFEDASVTLSWLGIEKEQHAEVKTLRHQLVKELSEAAKMKKKLMMATTKAAALQGKGRNLKLKINAHDAFFPDTNDT